MAGHADGFFGVLHNKTADLDGPDAWNDFRTDVPVACMQEACGHQQWLDNNPARLDLFWLPGAGLWTAACDYMHAKYLGSDQYFYGNITEGG